MSERPGALRPVLHGLLAVAGLVLSGCGAPTDGRPLAWIDAPVSGAVVVVGETVEVHAHAYAASGVAEGMLAVNGEPYRREPPMDPRAAIAEFSQTWVAGEPGMYSLTFTAYGTDGTASLPATTSLTVIAEPTPTATPEPTPTPTPVPLSVEFSVERASLTAGECTHLQWTVQGAEAILLDGTRVDPEGAREICPTTSITYVLRASSPTVSEERSVSVTVSPPPDTSGPVITGLRHSPESIWGSSACGPSEATISVNVTDPAGVASVELHYRVVRGSQHGAWLVLSMAPTGGSGYSRVLTVADLNASQPLYGDDVVEYYVVARDGARNASQSGTLSFVVRLCFG